jgi:hypothetical protein
MSGDMLALVINLKTISAPGITIQHAALLRADEVVEGNERQR